MKKVLFVCTGNTCRSPMAEVILNKLSEKESFIIASSAGISIFPGSKTSLNSRDVVLKNLGVDLKDRYAVQLTEEHIEEQDLILSMTESIKKTLADAFPFHSNKIFSLCEYAGESGNVVDPFGGELYLYEKTFVQLEKLIGRAFLKIKEEEGII
ncbi:MAG: low molecular weight protein arginine phosphatase [Clostridiaceae bacterium]